MIEYDSRNWFRYLFSIRGSVAPRIFWRVTGHASWSVMVILIHQHLYAFRIPSTVHALIGVALGLLLVFRTNASYDRYWEGRKAWGDIVSQCRNVARGAAAFLAPRGCEHHAIIVRWTMAFPYAAMHALRGERSLGPAAGRLPAVEAARALAAPCVPLAVATRVSVEIADARRAGRLFDQATPAIDRDVGRLVDAFGVCERIHKTPLVFAYVVHLRRALMLYLLTLPVALVDGYGWYTVFDNALIAYILLGIEDIGVEIENPFGMDPNDLPLEEICQSIEDDLTVFLDPASIAPTPPMSASRS